MEAALLRRVVDLAEELGIVLTFEVQGAIPPSAPPVLEVLELQRESGTSCLGFTIDFSLTTPALPVAFGRALRRSGVPAPAVAEIHRAWSTEDAISARIEAALAIVSGHRDRPVLSNLIAGMFGRCGRSAPADWADVLPLVRHAHAKFWDPNVESVREPHGAWLVALDEAGYAGAVVSEWGGHELLDRADADAIAVTRAHLELLSELTPDRAPVTA